MLIDAHHHLEEGEEGEEHGGDSAERERKAAGVCRGTAEIL
jgi:hypothetical protein